MKHPRSCLVIGASGQLGRSLAGLFREDYAVTETVRRQPAPHQKQLDLCDAAAMERFFERETFDIILIAGAYTNVDRCEEDLLRCREVNVGGPLEIARRLKLKQSGFIVYYSTDHVFDGSAPLYGEDDPAHPLNVYSRSKVDGEAAVRETLPDRHLILRTSWLYGPDPLERNFPLRLVRRLQEGERVFVPEDQWGSPTFTEDLAQATRFLIEKGETGTFHVCGPDFVNRYGYASRIASLFDRRKENIVPTSTAALGQAARRPLRVRLDRRKLLSLKGPRIRSIEEGLCALKEWWQKSGVSEPSGRGGP